MRGSEANKVSVRAGVAATLGNRATGSTADRRQPRPPRTKRPASPFAASPAMQQTPQHRISVPLGDQPRHRPRPNPCEYWPPPSTTTETFGPEPASQPGVRDAEPDALRQRQRIGDLRRVDAGKRAGFDGHADAHGNAEGIDIAGKGARPRCREKPRNCRLPRAVTSTMPLPCRAADSQSPIKLLGESPPETGKRRTSNPSPVGIGADKRRAGAASQAALMPPAPIRAPRRSARRGRRRRNCAADATGRAVAPKPAVRRWRGRPPGFRGSGIRAPARRRHRHRGSASMSAPGMALVVSAKPTSRSTVSANSEAPRGPCRIWPSMKRGLVARALTTRVTASVTERGRGRAGSVVSSTITSALRPSAARAAEKPPMKATSAEPSRMSRVGSSPVWTSRSASATRPANAPGAASPSPSAPP